MTLSHDELISRIDNHRIDDPSTFQLSEYDPDSTGALEHEHKDAAKDARNVERKRIRRLQERLYAEHGQALLVVLQATDTGGKDSTIRRVFKGVNPQGVRVWSFKQPSVEELDHDYLWRYHRRAPAKGMIAIFNRSHYEDVLVVRVKKLVPQSAWTQRYEQINEFEELLSENGIRIVKIFLNVSKDEQRQRLQDRLDEPDKHWKFSTVDLKERAHWDDYQQAFEDAIRNCSPAHAPWHVVPANHKWYRDVVIARIVAETLDEMNPQFPPPEAGLDKVVIPV